MRLDFKTYCAIVEMAKTLNALKILRRKLEKEKNEMNKNAILINNCACGGRASIAFNGKVVSFRCADGCGVHILCRCFDVGVELWNTATTRERKGKNKIKKGVEYAG